MAEPIACVGRSVCRMRAVGKKTPTRRPSRGRPSKRYVKVAREFVETPASVTTGGNVISSVVNSNDDVRPPPTLIFVDIETNAIGSFRPPTQYPIQLAFIQTDISGKVIRSGDTFISGATKINRRHQKLFTLEDANGPQSITPQKAIEMLLHEIRNPAAVTLVAHNIEFDRGLLIRHADSSQREKLNKMSIYDTMKEGASICRLPGRYGDYKYPKLSELADRLNVSIVGKTLHNAVDDVEVTRRCYMLMHDNGTGCEDMVLNNNIQNSTSGFTPSPCPPMISNERISLRSQEDDTVAVTPRQTVLLPRRHDIPSHEDIYTQNNGYYVGHDSDDEYHRYDMSNPSPGGCGSRIEKFSSLANKNEYRYTGPTHHSSNQ